MQESFISVASDSFFPIQNLPYGVFRPSAGAPARCGVAIGDQILDLSVVAEAGLLSGPLVGAKAAEIFSKPHLNEFMALGKEAWHEVRVALQQLLDKDTPTLRDNAELRARAFVPQAQAVMELPAQIGDYTDFYSSKHHAMNLGTILRGKDAALNPNWVHIPIGYHGRSSSVVVTDHPVVRPNGQSKAPEGPISFGPSKRVDFELEMAFFVGAPNKMGEPIPIERAEDHIFGLVVMNDWSARDIQAWEYVPLGPFAGKNFCTTISPWIVTLEALEQFKCEPEVQEPAPLPYLQDPHHNAYDIKLEVSIRSEEMRKQGLAPMVICRSNHKYLYWSIKQQLVHHAVNGCPMRAGDLLASGTISGPERESWASLMELSWKGETPLELPTGEKRTFILDGDEILMTGFCEGNGFRLGFGSCNGQVLPAPAVRS